MKTLVILNCIDDAMHFRSNFLDEELNCFFVSTHPSVNDYLEYNNIRCAHLAEYIGYDTIREIIAGSEGDVNGILLDYDKRFSCLLSNALGIDSFNWFYPLYRYMSKYENLGIRKTYVALRVLLRQGDFGKVFVYLSVNTGFYERESNLLEIARSLHPNCVSVDIRGTTKDYLLKAKSLTSNKTSAFLKNRYYKHVLGFVPKAHDLLESLLFKLFSLKSRKRKDILLFLPLFDLKFLKSVLRDKALLIHSNGDSFCTVFTQEVKDKLKQIEQEIISVNQEKDEDVCAEILRKNIIFDFCCNLEHNSSVVKGLDLYHKKKRITLAIWGNPPEWKTKALMVSYLLQQRVTVIGAQHGSFYCEFNVAWDHFDSDFNWCNYYLSYGFNEEDLKETYPWHNKLCTIIPSGHISYTRTSLHKRETIDLLLPLKPCSSFMMEGTDIKSSDLANIQKELLRFLNTFKNKRIVVKLYIGSNDKNSAVLWLLKRLHNLEIISDLSFPQVLERYNVRGVLIESASTTIRDAMANSGNCEVFLLHNTFFQHSTLNKKFKDAMSKSVHIFEELPSLKNAIRVFFEGNSEKKDTDFYRRKYYQRPHTKETIMELIRSVTK